MSSQAPSKARLYRRLLVIRMRAHPELRDNMDLVADDTDEIIQLIDRIKEQVAVETEYYWPIVQEYGESIIQKELWEILKYYGQIAFEEDFSPTTYDDVIGLD